MLAHNSSAASEQEALWYLGGQRIITALGGQVAGSLRLTEWATPAGTVIYAQKYAKEDEALYVLAGEAAVVCGGQSFPVSAGTFLFLPGDVPHQLHISASAPLRYLGWMTPAGFAQDVTKTGTPGQVLLLAPPSVPDSAKAQHLANLLRAQASCAGE
jgi:mannose-6-phosphate isomerase-like protein (cupin superfamily)